MTREEIYKSVTETLVTMFDLAPEALTPQSRLVEDLGLDSIDAVDMAAKIHELTGERLQGEDLRRMRNIDSVVDVIAEKLHAGPA